MDTQNDQLLDFENELRTTGVWCTTKATDKIAHLMISKHPKATLAISRCGMIVVPFYKLSRASFTHKCLVCSLYQDAREEVKERNEQALQALVQDSEAKQP